VEERGQADRLVGLPEREKDVSRARDEDDAVIRDPRGLGIEAEVSLVEPPRALLVSDGEREVRHSERQ
jgi:hypothetical protein